MSGVAVLDIGKTHLKVLGFDASGAVVAERSRANAPLPPDAESRNLRLDVEGAWNFLLDGLREIAAVLAVDRLSITTHGASGVLVDAAGAVAAPMDYKGDSFDAAYDAIRPPFCGDGLPRVAARPQSGPAVVSPDARPRRAPGAPPARRGRGRS
jgi:hypothetical protein